MKDENWFPWLLAVMLIGGLVALLFVPPQMLDIRPDKADPVADAGPDIAVNFGQSVHLDGSSSTDDKGIQSFEWMVENGMETLFLRGAQVDFVFSAPGQYTVTLTVTDHADNQDTDEVIVTVA